MSEAPVRLRGHHLICLQFYRGEGYSPGFVENLSRVVELAAADDVEVSAGADDVCAACPGLAPDGTCLDPNAGELEVRRIDRLAHRVLGTAPGERLSLADARARMLANPSGAERWRAESCNGCAWEDVCVSGWRELADAE